MRDSNTQARLDHESMLDAQCVVQELREARAEAINWSLCAEGDMPLWSDERWAESGRELSDAQLAAIMRLAAAQITDILIGHGETWGYHDEATAKTGITALVQDRAAVLKEKYLEWGE